MGTESEQNDETKRQGAIQPFHQRFSIKIDAEEAQKRFLNRVSNIIPVIVNKVRRESDNLILWKLANKIGVEFYGQSGYQALSTADFYSELELLEATYQLLPEDVKPKFANRIKNIISESEIDLGIEWRNGAFWPSGAKLLDKDLINENLKWLAEHKYTSVLSPFEKGLRHFLEAHKKPEKLADAITDVYEALEALAKVMVGKDKDLSGNAELFIKKLGLSNHYKEMLKEYISYACDYRHAVSQGKKRVPPKHNEVEAFIYTTGLFIRLAIRQLE